MSVTTVDARLGGSVAGEYDCLPHLRAHPTVSPDLDSLDCRVLAALLAGYVESLPVQYSAPDCVTRLDALSVKDSQTQ